MSTPKLFTIANDLSEMQILAPVDESDIGQIKEGQAARFTVKAYPERKFSGVVRQVRLQSTVDQNIVNYTVVIAVKNPDGTLLPGMTATVDFVVASVEDVLKVTNAALRFRPPEALLAEARERMQKELAARRAAGGERGGATARHERRRLAARTGQRRPAATAGPAVRPATAPRASRPPADDALLRQGRQARDDAGPDRDHRRAVHRGPRAAPRGGRAGDRRDDAGRPVDLEQPVPVDAARAARPRPPGMF